MQAVLELLESMYPVTTTDLHHNNPFELLVATILSAQCTDERVNLITAELFPAFPPLPKIWPKLVSKRWPR